LDRASEELKEKLEIGKISINKAHKKLLNEERRQHPVQLGYSLLEDVFLPSLPTKDGDLEGVQ
jgi:hypothetical protein